MSAIPQIDISDPESLDPSDPAERSRKLWVMVLLLAVKDMATVVRFEPHRGRRSLIYRVNGLYHDLMSPPRELANELIDHIQAIIDQSHGSRGTWLKRWINQLRPERLPTTPKALVELRIEDQVVDAIVSIPLTKFGRSVVFAVVDGTEWADTRSAASQNAAVILKRMLSSRESKSPEEPPAGDD